MTAAFKSAYTGKCSILN